MRLLPKKSPCFDESDNLSVFEDKGLVVTFSHPADWGVATLKSGVVSSPGEGEYSQVTFSGFDDVDINFVTDAFFSPLDGCPTPAVVSVNDASANRASIIGWQKDNLKRYFENKQGGEGKETMLISKTKSPESDGFSLLNTEGNMMVYRDLNQAPISQGTDSCDYNVPEQEAADANKLYLYTRFALNFTNDDIVGVNARYDNNSGIDVTTIYQLVAMLNSVK